MDIIKYFNRHHALSLETNDILMSVFKQQKHPKGKILLMPENRSDKLIFIESGLIRLYYQKDDKDITFLFIGENSFSMPIDSIIYNQPSKYGWQVVEDCTLRTISYKEFEKLLIKIPAFESITREVLFEGLKMISDKLYALQFQTAEQRYQYMMEIYPNILLRVPLGHIASYLGITQQTLSVIRGKK
jgi:CRP-like cAMP-binding protein